MLCSIGAQGWRPMGNGRGTQISQEQGPNTNVLTLRKGQDITLTSLEVDLGLLPSLGLTHMPALVKHLQIPTKSVELHQVRELAQHVLPAVLSFSYPSAIIPLHHIFPFVHSLASFCYSVRTEVWVIHFVIFPSRSQLFFLTCFPSLSPFPLPPNLLFSSFSYLPKTDLNKSMGKSFEWDFCLQRLKDLLHWHCIPVPYLLQKATFTWSERVHISGDGEKLTRDFHPSQKQQPQPCPWQGLKWLLGNVSANKSI